MEIETPTAGGHGSGERRRLVAVSGRRAPLAGFWRQGLPAVWSSGFMLLCVLAMLAGMLVLTLVRGLGHFWPSAMLQIETTSGAFLGPVRDTDVGRDASEAASERLQLKIGNRDLYGLDFRWFDSAAIQSRSHPQDAVTVEREEFGNFHGYLREVRVGERVVAGDAAWQALDAEINAARELRHRGLELDGQYEKTRKPLSKLEQKLESAQRQARARDDEASARIPELRGAIATEKERLAPVLQEIAAQRDGLVAERLARDALFEAADGTTKQIQLDEIVRAYRPNSMSAPAKVGLYVARLWEFIFHEPRESNTEGGIFPALFGTVLMVLLMTIAVVPLGIVAALYLHEYAREGPVLRAVRLAVNNLAGVPSIVFGMFGLAFFVYGIGGFIDRTFYAEALPAPTFGTGGILWASLTLALLTLPVVVVATEEGLASVPSANREGALALGATKWQTLWNVVLPQAVPGILTGVILAISRAAGEVAPLMLTGVVKLAPSLPLDGVFPFAHLERKFMHLGFHIYDVSMQSPNVEAAKPMVYSTTLLLLLLVVALNTVAIVVRNRMRQRYRGAAI
ncbi:MAG: phosphate ABC transporter permease PstA [Candidatus Latescibacterota bacterium]|nr:MAG: phosphate ABC transporter permease PstA [Candidatus Latescibacterota bacterium]